MGSLVLVFVRLVSVFSWLVKMNWDHRHNTQIKISVSVLSQPSVVFSQTTDNRQRQRQQKQNWNNGTCPLQDEYSKQKNVSEEIVTVTGCYLHAEQPFSRRKQERWTGGVITSFGYNSRITKHKRQVTTAVQLLSTAANTWSCCCCKRMNSHRLVRRGKSVHRRQRASGRC